MTAEIYVTKASLPIKKGHFQIGDVLFYLKFNKNQIL